jgi:hypothetical protein
MDETISNSTNSWQIFRLTVHRDSPDDDGPVVEVKPERSAPPEASLPDGRETRGGKKQQDRKQR